VLLCHVALLAICDASEYVAVAEFVTTLLAPAAERLATEVGLDLRDHVGLSADPVVIALDRFFYGLDFELGCGIWLV
jgi:hypothetical protein